MARGRMIATTVADDKRLNDLSLAAELVFLKTIPHLDRDGMILGEPLVLWGKVCRRRPELIPQMEAIIAEWLACKLAIAVDSDEGCVLFFPGFGKNQGGMHYDREAASVYPCPPGYGRTRIGLVRLDEIERMAAADETDPDNGNKSKRKSGKTPDKVRTNSGVHPDEVTNHSELSPAEVKDQVKDQDQDQPPPPPTPSAYTSCVSTSANGTTDGGGGGGEFEKEKEIAAVLQCWRDNMQEDRNAEIEPVIAEQLTVLTGKLSGRSVIHGITTAVGNKTKKFGYVAVCAATHFAGKPPPKIVIGYGSQAIGGDVAVSGGRGTPTLRNAGEEHKRQTEVLLAGRAEVSNRRALSNEEMKAEKERQERGRQDAQYQRQQQQLQQGRPM